MPPGQRLQVMAHNVQGGALLVDALQLELQALGQVLRSHPGGLQPPEDVQRPLQPGEGDAAALSQLVQGDGEIAPLVQAGGQIPHRLGGLLLQVHGVELSGEEAEQGLLQTAVGPHPGQGVQLLLAELVAVEILVVVVLQPLEILEQLVLLLRGGGLRLQVHQGVVLGQLAEILLQLHGPHLEHLQSHQLLVIQLLGLYLG